MDSPDPESLREQSRAERQAGNLVRADALAREAVEADWKRGDARALSSSLIGLAAIAVERREFDRAATLLGAAESLREGRPPDAGSAEDAATRETLAAAMDADEFERAQRSGRAMSAADAAGFALGTTEGGELCR